MRVLVCGGRDYRDKARLFETMDRLDGEIGPIVRVIHGGANGADYLAGRWAQERRRGIEEFAADWNRHGRAAGPIRNQQMLDVGKPDLVVSFRGGRGTANMVRRARAAGVRVIEISP